MFKGKVRVWVCKYSEAYVSLRYSLPPTGWYNPSYYSEVVRAELDKPLGHIRVLDTVPPHPLIARDRETEKVMEAIRDFKDWCSALLHCDFILHQTEEKWISLYTTANQQPVSRLLRMLAGLSIIQTCWGLVLIISLPSSLSRPFYPHVVTAVNQRLTASHNQYQSAWWRLLLLSVDTW